MIPNRSSSISAYTQYKNVHEKDDRTAPKDAILLEMLKPIETRLQQRQANQTRFSYPLWFLAETERNVYLWRTNHSLIDQHRFQFWVCVEALIEKRLQQLQRFQEDNIFLNVDALGSLPSSDVSFSDEHQYFHGLLGDYKKIKSHAQALSHVGMTLEAEASPDTGKKQVILPCDPLSPR